MATRVPIPGYLRHAFAIDPDRFSVSFSGWKGIESIIIGELRFPHQPRRLDELKYFLAKGFAPHDPVELQAMIQECIDVLRSEDSTETNRMARFFQDVSSLLLLPKVEPEIVRNIIISPTTEARKGGASQNSQKGLSSKPSPEPETTPNHRPTTPLPPPPLPSSLLLLPPPRERLETTSSGGATKTTTTTTTASKPEKELETSRTRTPTPSYSSNPPELTTAHATGVVEAAVVNDNNLVTKPAGGKERFGMRRMLRGVFGWA